jgi:hypothetical protein
VSNLGLVAEAFERRLRVVRPRVPEFAAAVELRDLRVGDARAHLRFERHDAATTVEVVDVHGELEILWDDEEATR